MDKKMEIRRWSLGLLEKETLKEGFKEIKITPKPVKPQLVKRFRKSCSGILTKIREINIEKQKNRIETEAIKWKNWNEWLEYNDEEFEKMLSEFKKLNDAIEKRDRRTEKRLALRRLKHPGVMVADIGRYEMIEKFLEKYRDFILAVVQEEKIQYPSVFDEDTSNYNLSYVFEGKPIFDFTGCKTKRQLNNFFTFVKLWLKMFSAFEATRKGRPSKYVAKILGMFDEIYKPKLDFASKVYERVKETKKSDYPSNTEINQVAKKENLSFSVVRSIFSALPSGWAFEEAAKELRQKTDLKISTPTLRRLHYTTSKLRK